MVLEKAAIEWMILGLHEGSLELDANDKGGWTRQDLQGIECPQSKDDMQKEVLRWM